MHFLVFWRLGCIDSQHLLQTYCISRRIQAEIVFQTLYPHLWTPSWHQLQGVHFVVEPKCLLYLIVLQVHPKQRASVGEYKRSGLKHKKKKNHAFQVVMVINKLTSNDHEIDFHSCNSARFRLPSSPSCDDHAVAANSMAYTPFVIQNKALPVLSPYDSRLEILHSLTSRNPVGECKIPDVKHTKVTTARKPFIYLLQNGITIATGDLIPTLCFLARTISWLFWWLTSGNLAFAYKLKYP